MEKRLAHKRERIATRRDQPLTIVGSVLRVSNGTEFSPTMGKMSLATGAVSLSRWESWSARDSLADDLEQPAKEARPSEDELNTLAHSPCSST